MRKFLWSCWISLLFISQVSAQQLDLENTVCWKVFGNGIAKPVYLFGTIHDICLEQMFWSKQLDSIIAQTDEMIFEIDMVKFLKEEEMPENLFPFNLYRDSTMKAVRKGLNIDKKSKSFCSENWSYDKLFYFHGVEKNMRIGYLESAYAQYWALFNYVIKDQNKRGGTDMTTEELRTLYADQAIQKMYDDFRKYYSKDQLSALLEKRNMRWVKKMQNYLVQSSASKLFVFGAGHLPGDRGVINLLRKSGFTVSPVFLQTN